MALSRISITLPRDVLAAADRRARALDRSRSWLIVEALRAYLATPAHSPRAGVREPDDAWTATLQIDGRPVELEKAYSSIRRVPRDFVGFRADISALAAGESHTLELQLPTLKQRQLQGVFLENVEGAGPLH